MTTSKCLPVNVIIKQYFHQVACWIPIQKGLAASKFDVTKTEHQKVHAC
jgi:hypothetical protein